MGYPSLGSWVTYGLGSVSDNLPAYVVMLQPEGTPEGGAPCWGAGFLPAVYQGTLFRNGASPIVNLKPPEGVTAQRQRRTLDLLQKMNEMDPAPRRHRAGRPHRGYELAFRMQSTHRRPSICRRKRRPPELYGLDQKHTADFGTRCLLARRLVERGVRFVQLYSGGGPVSCSGTRTTTSTSNHEKMCGMTDQPIAALLHDLKQRGLLDSTLVVWGSEFGRTPMSQGGKGRDHNPYGYTMWLAGGGVKAGRHRRDRRIGPARCRHPLFHARLSRHDPAPARPGPEPLLVPPQRAQRETDRLRRRGNQGNADMKRRNFLAAAARRPPLRLSAGRG